MYDFKIIVVDAKVKSNSFEELTKVMEYLLDNNFKFTFLDNINFYNYLVTSEDDYQELREMYAANSKRL